MSQYPTSYETRGLMAPVTGLERLAGVISHGSMLLAMPLFVPVAVLVVSLLVQGRSSFVRHTAIQALLFQLLITLVGGLLLGIAGVAWGLPFITAVVPVLGLILGPLAALISWPVALVFAVLGGLVVLWGLWIELVATWKAFNGEPYRMPIVGGFGA
jgi:uncharacterized membrane protein